MSTSPVALERLREIITAYYGLGEVALPEPLAAVHQRRHQKLVVQTDAGKFLAKTYERDPAVLDALRFQHRLSDHLHGNGLPVARIQPTREGTRIVKQDTWALELQEFISGGSMRITPKTLEIGANALGRFHAVCRDFPCPPRDATKWRFSEAPRWAFGKLYEAARNHGEPADCDALCNDIALFLHEAANALKPEKRAEFETGLIHGDWHAGNLIFQGDALAAIVDLEFAGDGCYLEDLAYAMSNLCIRTAIEPPRLEARTQALLKHYQVYRTLAYAEEAALYYAVGIKHITTVAYQFIQLNEWIAGYSPFEWLQRLSAQCHWLKQQAARVRWGDA